MQVPIINLAASICVHMCVSPGPAGKKQLKRKASTGTAGAARSAGCVKTSRAAGKGAAVARKPSRRTDPYEMDLDDGSQSDDEDAPGWV